MEKDMIFFSTDGQGLTSTSANHIANLAKEMIRALESSLSSMVLYSTSVSLIGTDSAEQLVKGNTLEELEAIIDKLHSVARAKSLIAWLREAIKAKERMINHLEDLNLADYVRIEGIEVPQRPKPEVSLDEDDYYASLSIDERNRYYETETLAAVLGKAIHPEGCIAEARENLDSHIRKPREVKGDGRDTLIYSFTPTVDPELVDDIYFRLQKQYREAQAEVNAFKHACNKAVSESEIAADAKDAENLEAYDRQIELLNARLTTYKKQRIKEIGDYRIIIPQSLKSIFDQVSHLGK